MDAKLIKRKMLPILRKYRVTKAGIFGSAARGQMKKTSDVDVLVKMPRKSGLFEFIKLKFDLETALGKPADLVEYECVKPRLKKRILDEEVSVL